MINVAYYRVSTQKQEKSGLGLDAQKDSVKSFLKKKPDFEFVDIQTGSTENRVEFQKAIKKCNELNGSRLVIAKLDRLSRNVHFISGLIQSGVDFVCCDNPHATPFTLHILAAVAEHELKINSERTKAALRAKVERERLSGNYNFRLGTKHSPYRNDFVSKKPGVLTGLERRQKVRKELIKKNPEFVVVLESLKELSDRSDSFSLIAVANQLNEAGYKTIAGGTWTAMQVSRELKKIKDAKKTEQGA